MTGPCSGAGVGVAKAGTSALTYVGPGAIGGALAGLSGWAGAAVGALLGTLTYELVTFCPGGPPAMPTFTATDITDILNPPTAVDYLASRQKFQDFLGNIFWPILCECTSGTSTLGAPSTYPSGGPQSVTVPPNIGVCGTVTRSDTRTLPPISGTYGIANLVGTGACSGGYQGDGFLMPADDGEAAARVARLALILLL